MKEKAFEIDYLEGRYISPKERKQAGDDQYVDKERRSFPILKKSDIPAAVRSWGRYRGSMTFEQFKARLTEMARKRGWTDALPKEWTDDKKKN